MVQRNYKKHSEQAKAEQVKAEPAITEVCKLCRGKYFRGAKDGSNTEDVVKEFGVCAASCVPSVSSASASCPYVTKSFL